MEAAFGWLGKLFEFLFGLLPHIFVVDADSRAVKYPCGGEAVEVSNGVHLYWPMVTNTPEIIKISRRTNLLNAQRLTTKDGYTVTIAIGVIGRVEDVIKAVVETEDFDDDINQACLRAVTAIVLAYSWSEITKRIVSNEFQKEVKKKAWSACKPYGYKVEDVFVSDWCETRVYSIMADSPTSVTPVESNDD